MHAHLCFLTFLVVFDGFLDSSFFLLEKCYIISPSIGCVWTRVNHACMKPRVPFTRVWQSVLVSKQSLVSPLRWWNVLGDLWFWWLFNMKDRDKNSQDLSVRFTDSLFS